VAHFGAVVSLNTDADQATAARHAAEFVADLIVQIHPGVTD
jgi:hypothetical protein